ncbi:hypothetical protein DERP_015053 [Dermatophagoides pteronyssinus]|uniref:Uncharacterized protein n=1 Tax=Dermatophagoides pteronyssinus TaxID=6956 RepID=A0ABQ8J5Q1_DERPT|nr:hypothetical protein DERP_015053 [Dermatophagoides pteronyssinus]
MNLEKIFKQSNNQQSNTISTSSSSSITLKNLQVMSSSFEIYIPYISWPLNIIQSPQAVSNFFCSLSTVIILISFGK